MANIIQLRKTQYTQINVGHVPPLSESKIANLSVKGSYGDGNNNLWLRVSANGRKQWVFRYMLNGTRHEMGLGPYPLYNLIEARHAAAHYQKLKHNGIDPIKYKSAEKTAKNGRLVTFSGLLDVFAIKACKNYRDPPRREREIKTLVKLHVPNIMDMHLSEIDSTFVNAVINSLYYKNGRIANRLQLLLCKAIDYAIDHNLYSGPNPVSELKKKEALPSYRPYVNKTGPLNRKEVLQFMHFLSENDFISSRCIEFAVLTLATNSEAVSVTWNDIDIEKALWSIPDSSNKSRHRIIPLSPAALSLVLSVKKNHTPIIVRGKHQSPLIFLRPGSYFQGITSNGLTTAINRNRDSEEEKQLTLSHFRPTFRLWAHEQNYQPNLINELLGLKETQHYFTSDNQEWGLKKQILQEWATFCGKEE